MMASHRPADPPPPPPEPTAAAPATPAAKTTLPASNFLVGFDWVLAVGVLALAFLLASFSVRHSDFWMHLATGRLMAEGKHEFGKDPFSFVGADRTWVNHAWIFDWLLYLLFKAGGGPAVVVAKAIVLTLTAGLLLLARKPGQSWFPGVLCVGLALVAAAPRLLLQPTMVSFLFLAALLFLIIRVPKRAGSWTFPILVAVLFCLWANFDQWFFLGPLVLVLYTVGQYIRPDEGEDGVTLWKAVGLGVLACMLNPYHVHVWTFPPELFDREIREFLRDDVDLARLVRGGLDKEAWDFTANPANPTALIALLALSVIGFAVNYRRLSAGLTLVWLGAVVLGVLHLRAIPFVAFVMAPVAAMNLAAAGRRLAETPLSEGQVRTLHALRSGARAAVGLVGAVMIAVTYPGWLHPSLEQRRWNWDVEPSPSMVRAAERIHQWRQAGTLPEDARLLNIQPDFANYVAWFAPGQKTYFDFRLRFHADDTAEYMALRRYLGHRNPEERRRDPYDLNGFLRKHRVTYAVSAHPNRPQNFAAVEALWGFELDPTAGPEWALWHVEGWAVILGWTKQDVIPTAAFNQLRFDPVRAAYAEAQPLPVAEVRRPLPPRDIWERYVMAPPLTPAEGEETLLLLQYRQSLLARVVTRHRTMLWATHLMTLGLMTPALQVWTEMPLRVTDLVPATLPPEVSAAAILAVRAARKAVAASPDHPDGYYFLAKAYTDATFQSFPEQSTVVTASLARCRARLPNVPSEARTNIDVQDMCDELAVAHDNANPKRLDLLFDVTKLSVEYLKDEIERGEQAVESLSGETRDRVEKNLDRRRRQLSEREKAVKAADAELKRSTDRYVNAAAGRTSPLERAMIAKHSGLVQEAIQELRKEHERLQKQLESDGEKAKFTSTELAMHLAVHAELIDQLLYVGQVEEASQILDTMETPDTIALMGSEMVKAEYRNARRSPVEPAVHYRKLRQAVAFCTGNFERAVEVQKRDVVNVERELKNYRDLNFPPNSPPPAMPETRDLQLDLHLRPLLSPLAPVLAQVAVMARIEHIRKVILLIQLAQARVDIHLRLALTNLEWGEIGDATYHLKQALDAQDLTTPTASQRLAKDYLRAIERARGAGP
jgi:hypothetical protein